MLPPTLNPNPLIMDFTSFAPEPSALEVRASGAVEPGTFGLPRLSRVVVPERRRPRHGSLERPINGRLYRGTWLLVGLPLLVLAFSVARPAALQPPSHLSRCSIRSRSDIPLPRSGATFSITSITA